jgi:hypothetical protein
LFVKWLGYIVVGLLFVGMGAISPTSRWAWLMAGWNTVEPGEIPQIRRSLWGRLSLRALSMIRVVFGGLGLVLIAYGLVLLLGV